MYALDPELVNWAHELTKEMKLIDDPGQPNIERFTEPDGAKPPFVLKGDQLAALTLGMVPS